MQIRAGGKLISERRDLATETEARDFVEGELERLYPGKWKQFNSTQYVLKEQEDEWWNADVIGYVWIDRNERELLEYQRELWQKKVDNLRSELADAEDNVAKYEADLAAAPSDEVRDGNV